MAAAVEIDVEELVCKTRDLSTLDQRKSDGTDAEALYVGCENDHHGMCAICLNKIVLQETALVKGCEHAYCVTCILRWAAHKKEPTCPQCKHPFEFLNIHRALDGSIQDYMFEESVCLLLRATWFRPLVVEEKPEVDDYTDDFYLYDEYDEQDDDLDEAYLCSSSGVRLGNRRWGDNGYVRAGRQEARPANRPNYRDPDTGPSRQPQKKEPSNELVYAGPSRQPQKKEPNDELVGRRAKRAMKREAADKAAAAKHQKHLARLGRDK